MWKGGSAWVGEHHSRAVVGMQRLKALRVGWAITVVRALKEATCLGGGYGSCGYGSCVWQGLGLGKRVGRTCIQ